MPATRCLTSPSPDLLQGEITTDDLCQRNALVELLQIAGVAASLNISAGIGASPFEVDDASRIHVFAELVGSGMSALLGWKETVVYRQLVGVISGIIVDGVLGSCGINGKQ